MLRVELFVGTIKRDRRGSSGYQHEAFRYAFDRDPHRHALSKAHTAERRLHIGEQRARSGGPVTVADGRRHSVDMTFEHAVMANPPARRMRAIMDVAELGVFEIA